MPGLMDQLRQASFGRSPLIFIHTPEEGRAVEGLEELAKEFAGDDAGTYVWDCVNGFVGLDGAKSTSDPVAALEAVLATKAKGFFVMRDLSELMDSPAVVRALRNTYYALRDDPGKAVVILSPELRLPTILQKEIYVVEMAPPQDEELLEHVRSIEAGYESGGVPEELYADIALALRGLTVNEVEHIMHRVLHRGQVTREEILDEIFNEKEMIVKKSGFLEFVPPRQDISQMGGVDELKDKGCVGLKSIFPPYPYDDERLFPFYERAEALKMPLLCHMGRCGIFPPYTIDDEFDLASQSSAYHHPKAVRAIAENFPGLRSIIGHSHGSTEVRSGSRETSGSGPLGLHLPSSMPEFSRIRRRVGHSCQLGAIARGPDGVREHPLLAERCYSLAPKALRRE